MRIGRAWAWGVAIGAAALGGAAGAGRLDLRLPPATDVTGPAGDWAYAPLDGSEPYTLTVRSVPGGFYEYEATRQGAPRPVLRFDRSGDGAGYNGQAGEGLDPCVPDGASVRLVSGSGRLTLEVSMPASRFDRSAAPPFCVGAGRPFAIGGGRDGRIRLRPSLEGTVGATPSAPALSAQPKSGRWEEDDAPAPPSEASGVPLGGPTLRDGAPLEILGPATDRRGRRWFMVRSMEAEGDDAEGKGEDAPSGGASAPARAGPPRPGGGDGGGISGKGPAAAPKGPPTGYLPADAIVIRWETELRPVSPGASGPEGSAPE